MPVPAKTQPQSTASLVEAVDTFHFVRTDGVETLIRRGTVLAKDDLAVRGHEALFKPFVPKATN